MKKILSICLLLGLTACGSDPNEPKPKPEVRREFEIDGCNIKYVVHPSLPNFYIARCGNTVTNTYQRQSGKSNITEATINVDSEELLRKRLAEIEAKNKALAKLSDAEKKALGLK